MWTKEKTNPRIQAKWFLRISNISILFQLPNHMKFLWISTDFPGAFGRLFTPRSTKRGNTHFPLQKKNLRNFSGYPIKFFRIDTTEISVDLHKFSWDFHWKNPVRNPLNFRGKGSHSHWKDSVWNPWTFSVWIPRKIQCIQSTEDSVHTIHGISVYAIHGKFSAYNPRNFSGCNPRKFQRAIHGFYTYHHSYSNQQIRFSLAIWITCREIHIAKEKETSERRMVRSIWQKKQRIKKIKSSLKK